MVECVAVKPKHATHPDTSEDDSIALTADVSLQCGLHSYKFSLADFDIGDYLGDGAHGCVFSARERRTGLICVLKCMSKAHLIRGGNEELIKKEVELQAHLKHPHICSMYTWFDTPSMVFMVMEYCLYGDLFMRLDKTELGFDEKVVAKFLFEICWAIRTCHDKRIAHLDIKPENVLVDHNYSLKLADFGLSAHICGRHRKRGVSIDRGTCDYFSPEQCALRQKLKGMCEKAFNEKNDIWTMGVLAFELYFKQPPFGSQCNENEQQVKNHTDIRVHHKFDQMSPAFKRFLDSTLAKTPEDRPTAEGLLECEWVYQNNKVIIDSSIFLSQPRNQVGHRGFNQPGVPWQTPGI